MTELKAIFGSLDTPAALASLLFDGEKRSILEDKLQSEGNVFSIGEIESEVNGITCSLVSLGAASGDVIAIYGFEYKEALSLYLASGQIGVNVVNLSDRKTLDEFENGLRETKARFVFVANTTGIDLIQAFVDQLASNKESYRPEFAVVKGLEKSSDKVLSWDQFQQLERFTTQWEINLLRVV